MLASCFGLRGRQREPEILISLSHDDEDDEHLAHDYATQIFKLLHSSMRFDCIKCQRTLAIICRTAKLPLSEPEARWFVANQTLVQQQMRTIDMLTTDTVLRVVQLLPNHPEATLMVLTSECGHAEEQPVSGRVKVNQ